MSKWLWSGFVFLALLSFQNCMRLSPGDKVGLLTVAAYDINLWYNPGFESGTSGLFVDGGGTLPIEVSVSGKDHRVVTLAESAHSGQAGLRLAYENVFHKFSAPSQIAGKRYRLSFWARLVQEDVAHRPFLRVTINGQNDDHEFPTLVKTSYNSSSWQLHEFEIVVPDGASGTEIVIGLFSAADYDNVIDIDDMNLVDVSGVP